MIYLFLYPKIKPKSYIVACNQKFKLNRKLHLVDKNQKKNIRVNLKVGMKLQIIFVAP